MLTYSPLSTRPTAAVGPTTINVASLLFKLEKFYAKLSLAAAGITSK